MVLEGTAYKFVPSEISVKVGDQVVFHNVSGGPHNVQFWADSIPAGAADVLNAAMAETMAPLTGPMKIGIDEAYEISFAGAPAGEYKYFCTPHVPFGMHAKITVQ